MKITKRIIYMLTAVAIFYLMNYIASVHGRYYYDLTINFEREPWWVTPTVFLGYIVLVIAIVACVMGFILTFVECKSQKKGRR